MADSSRNSDKQTPDSQNKASKPESKDHSTEKQSSSELIKYVAHIAKVIDVLSADVKEISADVKEINQKVDNLSTLSGIGKGGVSDAELAELACVISSKNMHQIALTCLGFKAHELENEKMGAREHQWQFNFNVLETWRNKCVEDEPRQTLAKALHKAAKDKGHLNYTAVQKILGISEDTSSSNLKTDPTDKNASGSSSQRGNEIQAGSSNWKDEPMVDTELTEKMMLRLAQIITHRSQLLVLALKLDVPYHRVEAHLCNYYDDINRAASKTLMEWFESQPCRKQAYQSLIQALKEANMTSLIDLLNC